jgi:hypothetical protein
MRKLRRFSQVLLTTVGSGIILYAVFAIPTLYNRVLVAVLGLLLVEAGIWELTRSLFPDDREFRPLRDETEYFLALVRRLNTASLRPWDVPAAQIEIDRLHQDMHHSVDRMRRLAGMSEDDLGFQYRAGLPLTAEEPTAGMNRARDEVSARAS